MKQFDVVALSETWVEEKQYEGMIKKLPHDYSWHWLKATRTKQRGRPAGGMLIGVKSNLPSKDFQGRCDGCWASIKVKVSRKWITVISLYNNAQGSSLRSQLEGLLEADTLRGNSVIIGGDLNARVGTLGAREEGEERTTMDQKINPEGEQWIEFFNTYNIELLNGNIDDDRQGCITRPGYKHQEEAVLDYAGVSCNSWEMIHQFRVGNEGQSDHFPLEITLNELTEKAQIPERTRQIWTPDTIARYKQELAKEEKAESWEDLKGLLLKASTLKNTGRHRRNGWWTTECYNARKELQAAHRRVKAGTGDWQEWRAAKRGYKATIEAAKRKQSEKFLLDLGKVRDLREGWKFIRAYKESRRQPHAPQTVNFLNHFKELLQGVQTEKTQGTPPCRAREKFNITHAEFEEAVTGLKMGKAAGPDQLCAESFVYADEANRHTLKLLIEHALNEGDVPESWCESTLWPVYKKGDLSDPANYRGIALGNAVHKLMATIIKNRLKGVVEETDILPDTQNGFRARRSTVDNIYILTQCAQMQLAKEAGKLYALFVDFKTAFDSIDRQLLFAMLRKKKVPEYLVRCIEFMYRNTTYIVNGERFESHVGLKQGCPLSPLLFAIYISDLDETLRQNQLGGLVVEGVKLYCLAYADDLALLATDAKALKDMIKCLHRYAKRKKLTINVQKTKVLAFSKGARKSSELWKTPTGESYEEVDEFQFLGVTFQRNGNFTRHHNAVARKANRRATEVWSIAQRLFPENFAVRMQMFEKLVLPIILYAAEVTGYSGGEEYEKIHRRYTKWTLGLPGSARTCVIGKEVGSVPVHVMRLKCALRYESRPHVSPLAAAAARQSERSDHSWGTARRERLNALGWDCGTALRRLKMEEGFGTLLLSTARDQELQKREVAVRKVHWYAPAVTLYLAKPHFQQIARLRCGAEWRAEDKWRGGATCRGCGKEEETAAHVKLCAQVDPVRLAEGARSERGRWLEYLRKRNVVF